MDNTNRIDYLEIPARDLEKTKRFFEDVFGWSFTDYGDAYTSFEDGRLSGGFFASDRVATVDEGSVLIVIYHDDLASALARVEEHGGAIVRDIFSFPGGRRFHFTDPSGNEFAVWSE